MKLITVRNKIIIVAVGIVLIFTPLLFYYFPNKQKVLLTEEYQKEVHNIATTVALGVNIALKEQSFEGVETSMQHAKADDRLTFVALIQIDTVFDQRGNVVLEKTEFSVYPEEFILDPNLQSSDTIVVSSSPITSEFLNGEVIVGFSTASIKVAISDFVYQSFVWSVSISILGVLFGFLLARSISRPIKRLKNAVHLVSEGDLQQAVIIKSKDEIGELSMSFNTMVSQLDKSEMQLKQQKELVEEKNQDIVDSIMYAQKIQESILPSLTSVADSFKDSFVLYMPKDIVSGDFYWMQEIDGQTLVSVADCTGHGVPGAFVSVVSSNALNRSLREHGLSRPSEILDKTNDIIRDHFIKKDEGTEMRDGMDISMCSLRKGETSIEYAGAMNPLWIVSADTPKINGQELEKSITSESGSLDEVKADKQPIGRHLRQKLFTNHQLDLNSGDVVYMFSDGIVDQFGGEKGKKFKTKAFKELLLQHWDKPLHEQSIKIEEAIIEWMGDYEQLDDICVIGIRI